MKITRNLEKFDERQIELLRWIAATVKASLENAKVPQAKAREITQALTFHVACVIDGSTAMGIGKKPLLPVLTFAADEKAKELIVADNPGSWMHEYAFGTAEEVLDGSWKARSPKLKRV